jgi:glycosyltransferase involved in cell wall biosynthesis
VSHRIGFNVIGHLTGNLGLGVTARNLVQLLLRRGFSVAGLDIDPGLGRGMQDLSVHDVCVASADALPYEINLFVLPVPSIEPLLTELEALVLDPSRINVAYPMWELSVLPPGWKPILEFFDVILAGSRFVRSTLDFCLSRTFVLAAEHPIFLPEIAATDRARFGLRGDDIVFLTAYEPSSDPARKNPDGAIIAFCEALSDNPHARLLVKANNAVQDGRVHPSVESLRALAGRSEQITFLTDNCTYQDVLGLVAAVDVAVSLHRAEGLGLVPMEAMAVGKPVVATAWSGSMSFMDHTNACLVDYELIPVAGSGGDYERLLHGLPADWAEPNLSTAGAWMKRLARDAHLREDIGRKAKAAIESYHGGALKGHWLEELMTISRYRDILCTKITQRKQRLRALGGSSESIRDRRSAPAHLADALARNRDLAAALANAETRLGSAEANLANMRASTSWRITAPLRALTDRVRGRRID